MALTLTVSDSGSGVGVATIGGAGALETVSLYSYTNTGDIGSYAATLRGSRVGPGVVNLVGMTYHNFIWQAVGATAGLAGLSPLAIQQFDDPSDPKHLLILQAVKAKIAALGFSSWLPNDKIFIRWHMGNEAIKVNKVPAVYICPIGTEEYAKITVQQDDPGYPVAVILVDALQNNSERYMARDLDWRARTQKALRWQRLSAVPQVYISELVTDVISDPAAFAAGYLVSAYVLRFFIREGRGI